MAQPNGWLQLAPPVLTLGLLIGVAAVFGNPTPTRSQAKRTVRLAYFPNLTHAPAVVGVARGLFQRALPAGVGVDPKVFNAGPEEMEALLAGEVDLGYVGPSPAINTYVKSGGKGVRILAGACSGGAALVARPTSGVSRIEDLAGKRVAIPQLGGTQDVSLRHFLARAGLRSLDKGGNVEILPIKNPDILALLRRGELDAAWVPEPWAARLIAETGARLVLDERDLWPQRRFTTTVLVARTAFLEREPELVRAILRAHLDGVNWLVRHPAEGRGVVNAELKRLTGKALPDEVLADAWKRLDFTADPNRPSVEAFVRAAAAAGYLPSTTPNIAAMFAAPPMDDVRAMRGTP